MKRFYKTQLEMKKHNDLSKTKEIPHVVRLIEKVDNF